MGKLQITNNVKKLLVDISKEREAVTSVESSFRDPLRMYQATTVANNKLARAAALIEQAEAVLSSTPELLDGIPLKLYQLICRLEVDEPGYYEIDRLVKTIGAPDSYRRIDNLVAKILKPCQQMFDANMQRSFDFDVMKEDMERKKSKVTGILITPKLCNYGLAPDVVTSYLQTKIRAGKEEQEQKNIDDSQDTIERFCLLPEAISLWESCRSSAESPSIYSPVSYLLKIIKNCLDEADTKKEK